MPFSKFVPAIIAAGTDVIAAVIVSSHPPRDPLRFEIYQIVMVGAALLIATPYRWVWLLAFFLLMAGVVLVMSVGLFYVPTVLAAAWVIVRRCEIADADQPVA